MSQQVVGRPQRVSIREIWPGGSQDLISWCADHLSMLSEALDLGLVTASRGRTAGSASDLIAEDASGRLAVVEVSLGRSGNGGLGRLLTYASALEASSAIWIVEDIAPEHIGAIAWLNRSGVADFYLLGVHGFRGPDGIAYHLLHRILAPSRTVRTAETERRAVVDGSERRLAFFDRLAAHGSTPVMVPATRGATSVIHNLTPLAGVTYNFLVGPYECGVEVRIACGGDRQADGAQIFRALWERRSELEDRVAPDALFWETIGSGHYRIALMLSGGFESPEGQWDELHAELVEAMARLRRAFRKPLRSLKV